MKEKYGDERRTHFLGKVEEIEIEELIPDTEIAVLITRDNFIKRMPSNIVCILLRFGVCGISWPFLFS
jgi:DNA gyrase/topoisomerase IV subunit A